MRVDGIVASALQELMKLVVLVEDQGCDVGTAHELLKELLDQSIGLRRYARGGESTLNLTCLLISIRGSR